jgi:lipoprotein NlpD
MTGRGRIFVLLISLLLLSALESCTGSMHDEAPFVLTGRWYEPRTQDTIQSIAALYGADAEILAELNDLPDDQSLSRREIIFIPMQSGAAPGAETAMPNREAKDSSSARKSASDSKTKPKSVSATLNNGGEPVTDTKKSKNCTVAKNPCLLWPVTGKLGARFGAKESKPHDGIDIIADKGTLVHAAWEGDVLYSGAQIKGYGNLVILRHEGGIITVYAHNDKNLVTEGAHVSKNAVIAEVGQSGNAAFSHLHFEVRVSETPRDPVEYLPEIQ